MEHLLHSQLEILKYTTMSLASVQPASAWTKKDLITSQRHFTTAFILILSGYYLPVRSCWFLSWVCVLLICTHKIRYPEMNTILCNNHSPYSGHFTSINRAQITLWTHNEHSVKWNPPRYFSCYLLLNHITSSYNYTYFLNHTWIFTLTDVQHILII